MPVWAKSLTFDKYHKQLDAWYQKNGDVEEHVKYQDVIDSLTANKEVSGLEKYVCDHVILVLDTVDVQTVEQIVGILKRKYGKTRMEEMEEVVTEWMKFNAYDHEDEDE